MAVDLALIFSQTPIVKTLLRSLKFITILRHKNLLNHGVIALFKNKTHLTPCHSKSRRFRSWTPPNVSPGMER